MTRPSGGGRRRVETVSGGMGERNQSMADPSWSTHVANAVRSNGIRMFATVPDRIVSRVLEELWADAECRVVTATREVKWRRPPVGRLARQPSSRGW